MAAAAPTVRRWLFGPVPDLLLGCGLLYGLLFVVFSLAGERLRAAQAPWLAPLLILLVSSPHYGATLLRVYEHAADRSAYVLFSLWATLLVAVAFVAGVYEASVGSWLVTVYLTWSPWHYTGQNYGLAVMFLRRRGVPLPAEVKRLLYASFVLSFGLVFVAMHAYGAADRPYAGTDITFLPLGIPPRVAGAVVPVLALAYAGALAAVGWKLRGAPLRDLAPSAVLVVTQALWFSIPFAVRHWQLVTGIEPVDFEFRAYYFLWIALGHAAQYLWVTTYYARASQGWSGYGAYLAKVLIAGNAIWTLPVLAFAPSVVGGVSYSGGLILLVAAAVNIHHFVLDGAIWKLRQLRIGDVLIRSGRAGAGADASGTGGRAWLRRAVWAAASAAFAVALYTTWQEQLAYPRAAARGDFAEMRAALKRLAWLGRDRPGARMGVEHRAARRAQDLRDLERRLRQAPSADGYLQLGRLYEQREDWAAALRAYESGLAEAPDGPSLLFRSGVAWLELGEPERARARLARAVLSRPWHEDSREALARAEQMLASRSPTRLLGY